MALAVFRVASAQFSHHGSRRHSRRSAGSINAAQYNKPDAGPPTDLFEASSSIPVAALAAAAKKAKKVAASYPVNSGKNAAISHIYSDWLSAPDPAYVFTADMDVDCDGLDYKCKGNPDGQDQTDYGALAAYEVPWIVIPESFVNKNVKEIPGNNVVAVICNGKMFYGIFGDSNGDSPEVTGEASWRMATACFPDGDINGNNGHAGVDVTYIVYAGKDAVLPSSALTKNYITNFDTLKSMGDKFTSSLAESLHLSGGSSGSDSSNSTKTSTKTTTSEGTKKTGSSDITTGKTKSCKVSSD